MGNTLSEQIFVDLQNSVDRGKETEIEEALEKLHEAAKIDRDGLLKLIMDNNSVSTPSIVSCCRSKISALQRSAANLLIVLMKPSGPDDELAYALQRAVAEERGVSPFVLMTISVAVKHQIAGCRAVALLAETPSTREAIDEAGGLKPLVILAMSVEPELQEAAIGALATVCSDVGGADSLEHLPTMIRRRCALYGIVETVVRLLCLAPPPQVLVQVARLCANLAEEDSLRYRLATQSAMSHFGMEMILRHIRAEAANPGPLSPSILAHLTRAMSHLAKDEENVKLFRMQMLVDLTGQQTMNESRLRQQQHQGTESAFDDSIEVEEMDEIHGAATFTGLDTLVAVATGQLDAVAKATATAVGENPDENPDTSTSKPTGVEADVAVDELGEEHVINAAVALLHLSVDDSTQSAIIEARGLRPLLALAYSAMARGESGAQIALQRRALWSLLNIASSCSLCRSGERVVHTAATAQQMVGPLMGVLKSVEDGITRRMCARALSFLSMRADCQSRIILGREITEEESAGVLAGTLKPEVAKWGVCDLFEVARRGQGEDAAQQEAVRCLANLCMVREPVSRCVLRQVGLHGYLVQVKKTSQNLSLVELSRLALANLLELDMQTEPEEYRLTEFAAELPSLIAKLSDPNPQILCKAAGAVAVTARCWATHTKLIHEDAVRSLIALLRSSLISIAAQREAAEALASMTVAPDGMVTWLKFESPNRLMTDTSGFHVPVARGKIVHVSQGGYVKTVAPATAKSRFAPLESADPTSDIASSDSSDSDSDDDQAVSKFKYPGKMDKGMDDHAEDGPAETAMRREAIRGAGIWGANFEGNDVCILSDMGVGLADEYTLSVWFFGQGGGSGEDGTRFQTLVEGSNGDRVVCVHPGTEERPRELGCYDRETNSFHGLGLSMEDVAPSAWHHLVVIASSGQTWFYLDCEEVGVIDIFQSPSPILAVGNAVSGGEAWGTIADFRIYPRHIGGRKRAMSTHHPFNALPWSKHALRGGEENLNYVTTQLVRFGIIPALVSLLRDRELEIMVPAVKALANLALYPENRVKLLEESALDALVRLSNSDHDELRLESCRALVNLY